MKLLHDSYEESKRLLRGHREALDKIADYLIRRETITGKEFMKIFRAVERGMDIPENLEDLVFPEDIKAIESEKTKESKNKKDLEEAEAVNNEEESLQKEEAASEAEMQTEKQETEDVSH